MYAVENTYAHSRVVVVVLVQKHIFPCYWTMQIINYQNYYDGRVFSK